MKSLLTAEGARRIEAAHAGVFRAFGYRCDPDPDLTAERADAHWHLLKDQGPTDGVGRTAGG